MRGWFVVALAAALAGCADSGSVDYVVVNFGGSGSGSDDKSIECGTDGYVTVSVGGTGNVKTRVTDGKGAVIFDDTASGSGGNTDAQPVRGAAGTWHLAVSWTNMNGGVTVTLGC